MTSINRVCVAIAAVVSLSLGLAACENDAAGVKRSETSGAGGVGGAAGSIAVAGGAGGLGGATPAGGSGGAGGMTTAASGGAGGAALAGTGGLGGSMATAGMGGATGGAGGAGGAGGTSMTAGAGGAGPSDDPFAVERQACVDTINMYRASIGRMPLMRATPEQEACSDLGAKQDGDSGDAHGSAGSCDGLGAQNTCPGYSLSFGGGTLQGTLEVCLEQMWDEGEPTEGVQACIADRNGCFQDHGHWINMQSESARVVACGFYEMADGDYWMNQNFGR